MLKAKLELSAARLATIGLTTAILTLTGCRSPYVQMYSGPPLPDSEIAVVENHSDATLVAVNHARLGKGSKTHKGVSFRTIELLPGEHKLALMRKFPKGAFPSNNYKAIHRVAYGEHTLTFEAVAGRRYVIGEDIQVSPFYRWKPWILDAASGNP